MATHYTATSKTITLTDYSYNNSDSTTISLTISVAADGAVSYSAKSTNSTGGWKYCGLWITVNGYTNGNNYFNTPTECANAFSGKFPIDDDSTYSRDAGTVSGGSVSYEIKLDCGSDGSVHGWTGSAKNNYKGVTTSGSVTRSYWEDSTAGSCTISQTAGSNTITFSGNLGTAGHGNGMSSATLYYWMNGATAWASESLTAKSGNSYKITKTCDRDGNIWAYVSCVYTKHTKSSSSDYKKYCYYYSAGGAPTCTISQDTGSNTVTISGSRGTDGSHNGKTASKLYYNLGKGGSNVEVNLGTTGSNSYTKTLTMDSSNNNKTITAYVTTTYTYGDAKTKSATALTSKYYSSVTAGTVTITDNGNNTFTLTGTKGSNGYNNAATGPTLSWGYDTNYSSSFTSGDTKTLTIATPANATRIVYAKSVTGKTNYGSAKEATTSLAVKQYVAPSSPSNIELSYDKSRLTIKETWTLEWTGGTASNSSSPVAGYRIRVWKNGVTIPFKNSSGEIKTNTPASTNTDANRYYYDRDLTSTEMDIDPVANGFVPGDRIQFTIHSYTKNGKGEKKFSSSYATSSTYTVQNAGIVRVKVGNSWKEGQVWIKTGGAWKEASSVHAKVSGSWKEST